MLAKPIQTNLQQQEILPASAQGFPLSCLRQIFSEETYHFIDWHWHTTVQYCYVEQGCIHFQLGQHRETLSAGEGLFINAQQIHAAIPAHLGSQYLCLNLDGHLLGAECSFFFQKFALPLLSPSRPAFLPLRSKNHLTEKLLKRTKSCCQKAAAEPVFDLSLFADLILLWEETLAAMPLQGHRTHPRAFQTKANARIQQILSYLQIHYAEPLTLAQIAEKVHLSRNECSRFFHRMTGESLFTYVMTLRIAKSIPLLLETEQSLADIAYAIGFSSQSYFSQRFRQIKGLSPLQFRKQFKH